MEWNLSHFLSNPTTGKDKVAAQEWLEEVTSAKDVVNSKAISNLDESRSIMKGNYKVPSPTIIERGSMFFLIQTSVGWDGTMLYRVVYSHRANGTARPTLFYTILFII